MDTLTDLSIQASGLSDEDRELINRLYSKLRHVAAANILRNRYYDHEATLNGLRMEGLDQEMQVRTVLGWNTKSVDSLSARIVNEGLVIPGKTLEGTGLDEVWEDNNLSIEATQIQTSALITSVGFLLSCYGDPSVGEPEVLVLSKDASTGTGDWDIRARRMANFLSITSADEHGEPDEMILYRPRTIITLTRDKGKKLWSAEYRDSELPYVPVEPIVYRGRTGRVFGSARISKTTMRLQDAALRTVVRSELAAHEHINPVRALLNADLQQFQNEDGSPNAAYFAFKRSRTIALPPNIVDLGGDQDTIAPQSFSMIQGMDMTPHTTHLEMFAGLFSAETCIPQSSLGVRSMSQPVSADAILAVNNDLILEAERAVRDFSPAWKRTALTAWRLKNKQLDGALPEEIRKLSAKFRNPNTPSQAALSDATAKDIGSGALPARSEVALERMGYSPTDIERIKADWKREDSRTTLASVFAAEAPSARGRQNAPESAGEAAE